MKTSSAVVTCLILLLASTAAADLNDRRAASVPAQPPAVDWPQYCAENCDRRCAVAGVRDRCLKYCGICCNVCHCVPPGTYGNKDACPCYRDLKNSKGGPKCP